MIVGIAPHRRKILGLLSLLFCVAFVSGCLSDPADAEPPEGTADVGEDADDASDDCEPRMCSEYDFECGTMADGCGDFEDCGNCDDYEEPKRCNSEGRCVCDPGDDQDYCESHEVFCGTIDIEDRCGEQREVDCGDCSAPDSCIRDESADDEDQGDDIPEPRSCRCEPVDCDALDARCGTHPDGCGGAIECGDDECAEDEVCAEVDGRWQCDNDGSCEPDSCEDLDAECGQLSDGCGGTEDCGSCEGPNYSCEDHQCVCDVDDDTAEQRCAEEELDECGVTAIDGCVIDCGECGVGCECEDGLCQPTGFGVICAISGFGD